MSKITIIIPTFNKCDLLRSCIESIIKYTDLSDIEIVVVSNGCQDGTQAYLQTLPDVIKTIAYPNPIGYTKAVNVGLRASTGDFIILLNNDIILLPQPINQWIDILYAPFKDPMTGISGPVKFSWDCNGIRRLCMAFWCVMFRRLLIDEIGYLDEVFSPGMGEDADFSIKTEILGYNLVQVPNNIASEFGDGIPQKTQLFPIYHAGCKTFSEIETKDEIICRNTKILKDRYGSRIENIYNQCIFHPCDINEFFPILRKYASRCIHITEMGVRGVFSTYAFLSAKPHKMVSYDICISPNINEAIDVAKEIGVDYKFIKQNVLSADIEITDLLFIDTLHTYEQLSTELRLHSSKVRKYIILHDTQTFGTIGESIDGVQHIGLIPAINEFLDTNKEWQRKEVFEMSNGLTILERK